MEEAQSLLSEQLTVDEKCELLQALQVKIIAKVNGDIFVNAQITDDLLVLLSKPDGDIIQNDIYSGRGSDRGWQDIPGDDSSGTPTLSGSFGGRRQRQSQVVPEQLDSIRNNQRTICVPIAGELCFDKRII